MIDLYCWTTPNGRRIMVFHEEFGPPYRIAPVNISRGEPVVNPEARRPIFGQDASTVGARP